MKIGMIFECGPDGADKKVCEHLARMIEPDITISSVTLDNKPNLISECGIAAAQLLLDGCDRVIKDVNKLKRCSTFVRFVDKLLGK